MADRKDIQFTEQAIQSASGTTIGRPIRVAGCDRLSVSFTVSVTAATLQGSLSLGGSGDDTRAQDYGAALPALTSGTNSALPTGITYSGTTGLFTLNNPSIGTSEFVITYTAGTFPRFVRPLYTFVSGGGTVAVSCTVAAWST